MERDFPRAKRHAEGYVMLFYIFASDHSGGRLFLFHAGCIEGRLLDKDYATYIERSIGELVGPPRGIRGERKWRST